MSDNRKTITPASQSKIPAAPPEDRGKAVLRLATVIRSIPGTYGIMVREQGPGVQEKPCLYVPGMMSFLFGAKDCSLPPEGSTLLVLGMPGYPDKYIGLCSVPDEFSGLTKLEETISFISMYGSSAEPGANYWSVKSYLEEGGDKDKLGNLMCNSGRPWTVLPGEWGVGNPMGVFIALFQFMATLKASERAKLECFVFDDLVRITSGQFQHWNPFGETHMFDDGGIIGVEIGGSHYAPEVRGYEDFSEFVNETNTKTEKEERYKAVDPKAILKRRFRMFMGGLGDMVQLYLRNMRDGNAPETAEKDEKWGASFKMHLDNSGLFNMSSVAGIGFSLNDKIPVPKRVKEAWDPEGDRLEEIENADDIFKKKEHYEYSDKEKYMRNLQALDAEAWEEKLSYQRFDELKKDFKVPEAADLQQVPDKYDHLNSNSRTSKYKNRKAGFKLEADGSIRIWDAWGSEIYTRGGDIIIACPGTVFMQPGKGIVGLGNDIVLKAKKSMDLTAEDKDVRVACGGNIMSRAGKGMLFQADGEGAPVYTGEAKGEDTPGGGIVFKAVKSEVHVWTRSVILLADTIRMKVIRAIQIAAEGLLGYIGNLIRLECNKVSGLQCSGGGSATLFGKSAMLAGANSANVMRGSDVGVFLDWTNAHSNPYQLATSSISHETNFKEGDWLSALAPSKREHIKFTYRTPEQYGTKSGIEVHEPNDQFKLYQTRWQLLSKLGGGLLSGLPTTTWSEKEIEGTYPWPGADSRNKCYTGISTVQNVKDASLEPNARDTMEGKFNSTVEAKSMDEYIIVQQ